MINPVSFKLNFQKFGNSDHFSFSPGMHVIYGESGCGKSHFIRSIAGFNSVQDSNFTLSDISVPESIQVVFQNPENQILSHTLESELAFAPENQSIHAHELQKKVSSLKSELPFVHDWNRHPESLSGGEMEMLNLVTAFSTDPQLILIDDGLSFLNENFKKTRIGWIRQKISNDKIVLWFSSDPMDLEFGETKWELSLSGLNALDNTHDLPSYNYHHPKGALNLKMDDLVFYYEKSPFPIIDRWSCKINQSRSIGLIGKNGKGKTTLSKLMTGLIAPTQGKIILSIEENKPSMAVLDQFPERMLGPDSLESLLSELVVNQKLNPRLINKCINRLNSYQIKWDIIKNQSALDIPWSTLRMALIIILSHCEYDVLILDEPTFGLGWNQKLILSRFFQEVLTHKHLVLISHDKQFVSAHCDQIYDLDTQTVAANQNILIDAN